MAREARNAHFPAQVPGGGSRTQALPHQASPFPGGAGEAAAQALPLAEIAAHPGREQLLLSVDSLFSQHPPLIVTLTQAQKLRCGAPVRDWHFSPGTYRVYGETGEFLLLGRVEGGVLTTIKSFFEVDA